MGHRERDAIDKAIRNLETETGLKIRTFAFGDQEDFKIQIADHDLIFNTEVRLFLNKARLGIVLNNLRNVTGIPLLITEYVTPELMKVIEENEINVIDTAGNAYIKVPPLFIKIKGNKLDEVRRFRAVRRPFYAAALQTIYALLCNPGLERAPIREIADLAGVAHGTVHITLKELEKQGYLPDYENKGKLINKEELLERWVILYPDKLKPKFFAGRYNINEEQIRNLDVNFYDAHWGGEAAAEKMTNYLRPYIYTIYVGERQGEFVLRNRLRRDTQGNLVVMKKFWNFKHFGYPETTHPILVYADLLATGDTRNIETAKLIYEKEIARYIAEN
ncbi:MAG: hypothetical protein AUK34_11680 [Ignavibacteria bacterium CG2_30_36_16]|nr:hypothetical protein [Ignavibacteria bacterium]OIP56194.1 MAG: hypothetical protein AUK34_11680 [Ignavibacteria bacterium CG2_30_36_16]